MFGKCHETYPGKAGSPGRSTGGHRDGVRAVLRQRGRRVGQVHRSLHDNTTLVPPSNDPNYYYQTDIADQAIDWIKAQKTITPDKPFFVYYSAQGTHPPGPAAGGVA